MWNDADFDKVISALRNMEKVRDEVGRLRASMFVDKCVREGEDIRVDFNEDTMTLLDDGYGESQTLSINDGFDEFLAK